jgi:hypothetical protein
MNSGVPYGKFEILADIWVLTHYIAVLDGFVPFTNLVLESQGFSSPTIQSISSDQRCMLNNGTH